MPDTHTPEQIAPEHVRAFAWATGYKVKPCMTGDHWIVVHETEYQTVPAADSPELRCALEDGLLAKGYALGYGKGRFDDEGDRLDPKDGYTFYIGMMEEGPVYKATGPTPTSALVAACLAAKKESEG